MATKEDWKDYFEFMNGRSPTTEEMQKALQNGEIDPETSPEKSSQKNKPKKKKIMIPIAILLVLVVGLSIFFTLTHQSKEKEVAVSGIILTKSKQAYSNQTVTIDGKKVKTDNNGQFFTHIETNKLYKVDNSNVNFTIEASDQKHIKTSGDLSTKMQFSTSAKTVEMTVTPGVAYFDQSSSPQYDSKTQSLDLTTNLQLKDGDKIIIAPSPTNRSGLAFVVNRSEDSNGQAKLKVSPAHVQDVLQELQIHSGNVAAADLSTDPSHLNASSYQFQPLDVTLNTNVAVKGSFKQGEISGSAGLSGNLQIDADYKFFDPDDSSLKVESSLKMSADLTATLEKKYSKDINLVTFYPPIPFVSVPIDFSANADLKASYSLNFDFSPKLTIERQPKKALTVTYNNAQAQFSSNYGGEISGNAGITAGPAITVYLDNLLECGVKAGIDGKADVKGSFSNEGSSLSGSGNLNFGISLYADSPLLNKILPNAKLSYSKEIFKKVLFDGTISNSSSKSSSTSQSSSQSQSQSQSKIPNGNYYYGPGIGPSLEITVSGNQATIGGNTYTIDTQNKTFTSNGQVVEHYFYSNGFLSFSSSNSGFNFGVNDKMFNINSSDNVSAGDIDGDYYYGGAMVGFTKRFSISGNQMTYADGTKITIDYANHTLTGAGVTMNFWYSHGMLVFWQDSSGFSFGLNSKDFNFSGN